MYLTIMPLAEPFPHCTTMPLAGQLPHYHIMPLAAKMTRPKKSLQI
jgi:hypothetical protein